MALLLDRRMLGRADGIIDPGLSEKMASVAAAQRHPDTGEFSIAMLRAWLDEYGQLTVRGHEIEVETVNRSFATPAGSVQARDVPLDGALIYSCDETSSALSWLKRR